MIQIAILLILLTILTGCATTKYQAPDCLYGWLL